MTDKWRIFFTIPMLIGFYFMYLFFGFIGVILGYLWVGFLIDLVCEFNYPKVIILWLPALWIKRVWEII